MFKMVFFILGSIMILFSSCFCSLKDMSLEEKVGQLLMVHFHGETANDDAKSLIQKTHVGGIIYYNWANGLNSPQQVLSLSLGLQKLAQAKRMPVPLFLAVDQEGGIVARLNQGFTIFPGNKALGMTENPILADLSAFAIGQELKAAGININLAPVVDINNNPRNPIIGIRSFGDTPELVLAFAEQALKGYRRAGIIATLKHYPGHGDVEVDSHEDLPIVKKSRSELDKLELVPFKRLAQQAQAIMTAHILFPKLDSEQCATLSSKILNILRNEMNYQGLIIADSLVMEGLLKNCDSVEDAAIRAFNAGCDILMLGGKQLIGNHANLELNVQDVQRIHQALVDAVRSGRISEGQVDESVQRILDLKNQYAIAQIEDISEQNLSSHFNTTDHQALAKKIASAAIRTSKGDINPLVELGQKKICVFAPNIVRNHIEQTSLLQISQKTSSQFFAGLNPSENEIEKSKALAEEADVVIFCSYNAWKNDAQIFLVQYFLNARKPVILLILRDPLDQMLFAKANLIFTTFSPTAPSIQAVCDQLIQNSY